MSQSKRILIIYNVQIAADYAKHNYQDFAVVVQPFFSNAKADKFPIEFLSDVSVYSYMYTKDCCCAICSHYAIMTCTL